MAKFITIREEFESETGNSVFDDQKYIDWLEAMIIKYRVEHDYINDTNRKHNKDLDQARTGRHE